MALSSPLWWRRATRKLVSLLSHFPYLGVFVLLILGGVGLPFPEETTLILSGFLLAHRIIRPLPALLVIYGGLLLSDFFLYCVGRKYGIRKSCSTIVIGFSSEIS